MGNLVQATALSGYPRLMRELGADPGAYLLRFRIPTDIEHRADALVPVEAFVRLLEVSADELQCPDFGLRLASHRSLDILGPVAVIARNSATVLDAMQAVVRYSYVHSPAIRMAAQYVDADVRITFEIAELDIPYPLQGYEVSLGLARRLFSLTAGPDAPSSMAFTHAQFGSATAYRDALGCPVYFNQPWCGLQMPVAVAQAQVNNADPLARDIATKYLEASHLPIPNALSERVAELARRLLTVGACSVDNIATELAMHPRTLQRHLATEGFRCQDLIDQQRRAQAARYLAEPRLHLTQIAALLGYTEQSAFNRSCRRWFGKTPSQYRAEQNTPALRGRQ
jgi:AraC-like DNA-binding protein